MAAPPLATIATWKGTKVALTYVGSDNRSLSVVTMLNNVVGSKLQMSFSMGTAEIDYSRLTAASQSALALGVPH
jgi:hypothetical protein